MDTSRTETRLPLYTRKKVVRYLLPGFIVASLFNLTCAAHAAILFGPTNVFVGDSSVVDVTTLASASLNGEDDLFITYSAARTNANTGDSWLTLTLNTTDSLFEFVNSGALGALTRTRTDSANTHTIFQATGGSWSPDNTAVDMDAVSPAEHALRLTISGLSSGGFTGTHSIEFEIDHNSSTFVSADRTFSGGVIDFGGSDVGLNVDLRAQNQDHNVNNLTVFQIPEPSSVILAALALLGLLAWGRRRRR